MEQLNWDIYLITFVLHIFLYYSVPCVTATGYVSHQNLQQSSQLNKKMGKFSEIEIFELRISNQKVLRVSLSFYGNESSPYRTADSTQLLYSWQRKNDILTYQTTKQKKNKNLW